jgi:hypothetical protein
MKTTQISLGDRYAQFLMEDAELSVSAWFQFMSQHSSYCGVFSQTDFFADLCFFEKGLYICTQNGLNTILLQVGESVFRNDNPVCLTLPIEFAEYMDDMDEFLTVYRRIVNIYSEALAWEQTNSCNGSIEEANRMRDFFLDVVTEFFHCANQLTVTDTGKNDRLDRLRDSGSAGAIWNTQSLN